MLALSSKLQCDEGSWSPVTNCCPEHLTLQQRILCEVEVLHVPTAVARCDRADHRVGDAAQDTGVQWCDGLLQGSDHQGMAAEAQPHRAGVQQGSCAMLLQLLLCSLLQLSGGGGGAGGGVGGFGEGGGEVHRVNNESVWNTRKLLWLFF